MIRRTLRSVKDRLIEPLQLHEKCTSDKPDNLSNPDRAFYV